LGGQQRRGNAAVADKLLVDIERLIIAAHHDPLTALQLAQGSKGLLDEVATSKITGEEDRYSHTDLWDFAANIEGSRAAIGALDPVLQSSDPQVAEDIAARFAAVNDELAEYRDGEGYVLYTDLTKAQVKRLSDLVAALSEPVSQVAAVVAGVQ
jgi:iron uptake system component EfeO